MARREPITAPCAMRRPDAALHVGVSTTHFDKLVKSGVMPSPRLLGSVQVWRRDELERALADAPALDGAGEATTGGWADLE